MLFKLPLIDLDKYLNPQYNLILSSYLPVDSIFEIKSMELFSRICLSTPVFINKDNGRYCIIELSSYNSGTLLLLEKKSSGWNRSERLSGFIADMIKIK